MNETIRKTEYATLSSFLMRALFLGPTVYTVLHIARQDSWVSIIISYILSFIPLLLYYFLLNHDSKLNIVGLIEKYGGPIGKIINIILFLFVFFQGSIVLWNLTNFISSQYLYQTPLLAIAIIFMLCILYMTGKGLKTIGRTSIILFILKVFCFTLAFISLISKIDLKELSPMFESDAFSILKSSFVSIVYNTCPLFLLLIIPKDNIEDNKKMVKSFLKMHLYIFITLFLVIFCCVTIFGVPLANLYQYPEYHILKTINIADFFQRVESILSIQWILDCVISIVVHLYFVKTAFMQTFHIEKHEKLILISLGILLIILSHNIFSNNTVAENFLIPIYPFIAAFFLFVIPLLILIVAKIRKNKA